MTARDFKQIPLEKCKPNPWNTRDDEDFKGEQFQGLVESIGKVGVLQPILVRPLKKDSYEIIFGECRWRASCAAAKANGGKKNGTIPAMVKEMTDDEAFDSCVIENLHRKDLSELQEARMFQAYADRHGKKAKKEEVVQALAERTSKGSGYINRRLRIMTLPEKVLKAWDKGQIMFSHCEQLGIFADPKAEAFLKDTLGKRKFSALKKAELDRVILESGVDLSGKVPAEILDVKSEVDPIDAETDCLRDENGLCSYIRRRACGQDVSCCADCERPVEDESCDCECPKLVLNGPVCRVCGCSEDDACEGGCSWVEDDLCSACADKEGQE